MFMTIQSNVKDKILPTPSETSKVENASTEMLHDLDQKMEKRADDAQSKARERTRRKATWFRSTYGKERRREFVFYGSYLGSIGR
ncbi:hypothetical protein Tco_0048110, partial [Tanacetum coccineum]